MVIQDSDVAARTGRGLRLTTNGAIRHLALARPEAGNAIDLPLAQTFAAAIDDLAEDLAEDQNGHRSIRVLVLSGTGKVFCAGGDLRAMAAATDRPAFVGDLAATMHAALVRLRSLPVVVIASVRGPVAGAGLGLVLSADIVLAGPSARFVASYPLVGLSPDCGVSALLPAVVGPRRAALLALGGVTLDAAMAHDWGLVSEVCAEEQLEARTEALSAGIAALPGDGAAQAALLLRGAVMSGYQNQLEREAATIARLSGSTEAGMLISDLAAGRATGGRR